MSSVRVPRAIIGMIPVFGDLNYAAAGAGMACLFISGEEFHVPDFSDRLGASAAALQFGFACFNSRAYKKAQLSLSMIRPHQRAGFISLFH